MQDSLVVTSSGVAPSVLATSDQSIVCNGESVQLSAETNGGNTNIIDLFVSVAQQRDTRLSLLKLSHWSQKNHGVYDPRTAAFF